MNTKKIFVVGGVVLVLVVVGAVLVLFSDNPVNPVQQEAASATAEIEQTDESAAETDMTAAAMEEDSEQGEELGSLGAYTDYSSDRLAADANNVIFFKADWCSTCAALERDIEANLSSIPADTQILVADYDNELDLRRRYGVSLQHTLVQVDEAGNEVKQWNGSRTLDSLLSQVV